MDMLVGISLVILSFVALVAIIGAFGLKFKSQWEEKKIEVTNDNIDNFKN